MEDCVTRYRMTISRGVESDLIIYPSRPTSVEWTKMAGSAPGADALQGTTAAQNVGPQIGRYDIYVGETAYMFCISLPGVDTSSATFSCEVQPFGEITIKGHSTTGLPSDHEILNTLVNNLPDSGPFAVTFPLPGPVEAGTLVTYSSHDGFLWGVVTKQPGDLVAESSC